MSRSAILDKDMLWEFHRQHPGKPGGSLEVPVEGVYYHGPCVYPAGPARLHVFLF